MAKQAKKTSRVQRNSTSESEKLRSVSVQLREDEIAALTTIAKDEERSLSYMIRRAVRQMLESTGKG